MAASRRSDCELNWNTKNAVSVMNRINDNPSTMTKGRIGRRQCATTIFQEYDNPLMLATIPNVQTGRMLNREGGRLSLLMVNDLTGGVFYDHQPFYNLNRQTAGCDSYR